MISINDQLIFVFNIGEYDDFLAFEQLVTFSIIEEAGNVLPSFLLEMELIEEEVIKAFNEGNPLFVEYGRDLEHLKMCRLRILRMDTNPAGNDKRMVLLRGLLDEMGWLNTTHCNLYPNMTALEVMRKVAEPYFLFDTTLTSQDRMNWIQPNISNKRFVNEVWMHTNLPGAAPLVAITADKRFIVKSTAQLNNEIKWKLTSGNLIDDTFIPYQGGYSLESRSGFFNSWFGYGRHKKVFDWEAGNTIFSDQDVKVFLAQAKSLNRQADTKPRYDNASFRNDNVHPAYWDAFLRNMSYLTSGSSVKLTCRVVNYYFDVSVLDSVLFLDRIQGVGENQSKQEAQRFVSGRYVVSKVVRNISNRQYAMMLELNKETMNEEEGGLR